MTNGVVEDLHGRQIVGWIEVAKGSPTVYVGLYINDFQATTVAAMPVKNRNTEAEIRAFRFPMYDFWNYVKRSDRVTVRADGRVLPFSWRGSYYRPRNDGTESVEALQAKLASGHVFASNGHLLLSKNLDLTWQASVMKLYDGVRAAVKEAAGYDVFFIYGSLLGAIRDNGFIGHDFDFDAAYVSRHRNAAEVGAELAELAMMLIESGFSVEARFVALHIYDPADSIVRIDLFHLYFDDSERLRFAWGVAGRPDFLRSQWEGTREIPFANSVGLVPRHSKALLKVIYGASWRIPNAGFAWAGNRHKRATEANIPDKLNAALNWENFYAWNTPADPSSFAAVMLARADLPTVVVDLGCGDGRDTVAFAGAGRTVVGLDKSAIGLRRAAERAQGLDGVGQPRFVQCDFDDAAALGQALESARPGGAPVLHYGRFLLHAVEADTQDTLFGVLDKQLRAGDYLALEFRTTDDAKLPKPSSLPFRRFLDVEEVLTDLVDRYDMVIEHTEQGTGLSPYGDEDPHLCRVIARRAR